MGSLAAVGPWFGKVASAEEACTPASAHPGEGRVHVVPSTKETVQLGVYDTNLPPILTIDSGDTISFPDTWSHFLNELQPGVPIDTLARLRMDNPGKGPQSIIGPIAVNNAEPGDVLEVRHKRIRPYEWGATFNNPSSVGTGLLPQDFPKGQVKYVELDVGAMTSEFLPNITIPLKPFQGTIGVAPPDGYFPPLSPGVTNAVPPGPHAGNLDLSELTEGSTLYIPVWKPGALIYTGDSHAVQGDGEICLTGVETRMKELQIQFVLPSKRAWVGRWQRRTHWILIGLDKDLHVAMTLAARSAIKFLARQAKISELDAYALCSVAVSFRVTQVVDIVRGVHALIPKDIFAGELRQQMKMV
jgi:acetamidase/formamidase